MTTQDNDSTKDDRADSIHGSKIKVPSTMSKFSRMDTRNSSNEYLELHGGPRGSVVSAPGLLEYAGPESDEEPDQKELKNESSSLIRFYPEWCHCVGCLMRNEQYSRDTSCRSQLRQSLLCPPQGPCERITVFLLCFILLWVFLWGLLHKVNNFGPEFPNHHSLGSPKGPVFQLMLLEILGLLAGILMKCIRLPSLLGPLVLGIIINNVKSINLFIQLENYGLPESCFNSSASEESLNCDQIRDENGNNWIKPIRQIALTMILTRAGLELSPKQLKKLKGVVPLLAFTPCLVEAVTCAFVTWLFFNQIGENINISWAMCFVCGFALAAVSPAVVVPGMLSLKRKNLGTGEGIPTLLIAASSIDDVLAISAYTICLGVALGGTDDNEWKTYVAGPLGVFIGVLHGLVVGIILHFIPARTNKHKATFRLVLILLVNLTAMFWYEEDELVSGAGSLAVLVTSFIASFGWRSQPHWKRPMHTIEKTLGYLWTLCVPLLFGTIGKEIDFFDEDTFSPHIVSKIIGVILICLLFRCAAAFLVVGLQKLTLKERLFCALAWIPKATVQAALAPLVISKVEERKARYLSQHANIVVTTATLAIILTAPLGSILIALTAPKLLKTSVVSESVKLDEEFPNGDDLETITEKELVISIRNEPRSSEESQNREAFSSIVSESTVYS